MVHERDLEEAKSIIRAIPDFPKAGILFQDIFPLFRHPRHLQTILDAMLDHIQALKDKPTTIVGLDARGFLLGPILALKLGLPFVPVRKHGKLPGPTFRTAYAKEYGTDGFEIQADAIQPDSICVIVDDLLATGGSVSAAATLVEQAGGCVGLFLFMIQLDDLNGKQVLQSKAPIEALFHF